MDFRTNKYDVYGNPIFSNLTTPSKRIIQEESFISPQTNYDPSSNEKENTLNERRDFFRRSSDFNNIERRIPLEDITPIKFTKDPKTEIKMVFFFINIKETIIFILGN